MGADFSIEENKTALVDISDHALTGIIEQMDDDTKNNLKLSDKEIVRLKNGLKRNILSETYHAPLICMGDSCCMSQRCPLQELGKAPVGKICVIELMLSNKWKDEYIESMEADWNDRVDRTQIIELIELDLINNRASNMLAEDGLTQEVCIGIDDSGNAVKQTIINLALDIKQSISNRRSKVLKEMIATREAKARFLKNIGQSPDEYAASLRERATQLEKEHAKDISVINVNEVIDVSTES